MKRTTERQYYAHEFAERVGVTVRTLHHYDHLGLLAPGARSEGGYRLYGERELLRLQQILTLKFVGFSLRQIRELLDGGALDLAATLRMQAAVLAGKRRQVDQAIAAVSRAEQAITEGASFDWQTFRAITEAITMEDSGEWVKRYYTEEQLQQLAQRWSLEMQAEVTQKWADLNRDIEASRGIDPASAVAQAIAERYAALIEGFTGGDAAIAQSLSDLYADRANWPEGAQAQTPYSEDGAAFIQNAMAIRAERRQS